jgi:hypothetical protein
VRAAAAVKSMSPDLASYCDAQRREVQLEATLQRLIERAPTDPASEFRAVILAIAREYGVTREDVIAAARELPAAPPARRGPKGIDDHDALNGAARAAVLNGLSKWSVAKECAQRLKGQQQSADSASRRLARKLKPYLDFYRRFTGATQIEVMPDAPFALAQRALNKIQQKLRVRMLKLPDIGRGSA